MDWIDTLKYDSKGLIPAIIQDYQNGQVLMMAYMNKTSIEKTLETGLCHYWSRSRQELWLKGGTSGHVQVVKEIYFDCDNDCLLFKVEQKVAACHTGMRSCFYRQYENGQVKEVGEKIFDAEKVYKK